MKGYNSRSKGDMSREMNRLLVGWTEEIQSV